MPVPRFTLVVLAAWLLVAVDAPPVTSASIARVAWTDELGDDARPGPLHYVALGDSFTSGEGDPYVDPAQEEEYVGRDAARRCALAPRDLICRCYADRAPTQEIVNAVGWLGDTGTDVSKLTGAERLGATAGVPLSSVRAGRSRTASDQVPGYTGAGSGSSR